MRTVVQVAFLIFNVTKRDTPIKYAAILVFMKRSESHSTW